MFFLCYLGLGPVLAGLFREIRYVFLRLGGPCCPVCLTPFVFLGVSMGDHGVIANLWGNPPWRVAEALRRRASGSSGGIFHGAKEGGVLC